MDTIQGSAAHPANDVWFWPRLSKAIPDVMVRLADYLVVVEAKYAASRHDATLIDDIAGDRGDQLCRQYRSVKEHVGTDRRYLDVIEAAIRQCRLVQVFLVDGRRGRRRAWDEYEESRQRLLTLSKDARINFVTWQKLYRLLGEVAAPDARWRDDLRAYLELVELDSFEGIRHRLLDPGNRNPLEWRLLAPPLGFRDAASAALRLPSLERVWRRELPEVYRSKWKRR